MNHEYEPQKLNMDLT